MQNFYTIILSQNMQGFILNQIQLALQLKI